MKSTSSVKLKRPGSTNECTEASPSTPLRVRNVEYSTNTKARMARMKLVIIRPLVRRCVIMVWISATEISHGMSEAFSTGSQPHQPPQPRVSYAQKPPSEIPSPSTIEPPTTQGRELVTQS